MKTVLRVCFILSVTAGVAAADVLSLMGTLPSADSYLDILATMPADGILTLQTYSFGGGTNAAGTVIPPGGTDPFLAIFSGTDLSATMVTDSLGDPYATSLDLTNYAAFTGCPPAGAPVIGGSPQCGDITMSVWLASGAYTVVLSDGQYIANAVFDDGTLGEGFTDLTGGGFCNLSINGAGCPNTTGAYALDITTPAAAVPEPSAGALLSTALSSLGWLYRRRSRTYAGRKI
jgi:hypothetical protein